MTSRHKVLAPLFELTEHCIFLKVALLSNYFACTVPLSTACSSVYTTLYIVYMITLLSIHFVLYWLTGFHPVFFSSHFCLHCEIYILSQVALRVSVGSTGQQSTDILWYTIGGSAGGFLIFIIIALILWKVIYHSWLYSGI